ncbi:MAG: PolC-type DNA polymerase III [Acidobacteriota bacterium]
MELQTLWERLGCQEVEDLGSVTIQNIKVMSEEGIWRLTLEVYEPIPASQLTDVANRIKESITEISGVDVVVVAKDATNCLRSIIRERGSEIASLIEQQLPELQSEISFEVEGDHLIIHCTDYEIWQKVVENEVCHRIEEWITSEYRMVLLVGARHNGTSDAGINVISEKEVVVNILESPIPANRRRQNNNKKKMSSTVKGQPFTIADLQEGLKDIMVEGMVIDKNVKELRDGRVVVVYTLTDFSDSVWIKNFDEDTVEKGDWIRVSGSVRYDDFEKDVVLFPDAMEKIESKQRTDELPEKRVELHLHTMMSALDAVTDVGDLMATAARFGHTCIAITDHGSVQAFPEAYDKARKNKIKVIFGVEGYLVDERKEERSYHIILLATNKTGLKNLYRLVSKSYIHDFYRSPKIFRNDLIEHREGLLLGSACERGEIIRAYLEGAGWEDLKKIAEFYDYLEIQPLGNNEFLIRDKILKSQDDLIDMNRKIIQLGNETGKPVAATCDVHFLEPHHSVYRRILQAGKGFQDSESQAPLYYRTTQEMLEEFSYLDEETAYEVVIKNPAMIADKCEEMRPVPVEHFSPKIEGAEDKLTQLVLDRARDLYKDPLPEIVESRINRELHSIITHGFSVLYVVAHELVKKSNSDGYLVGSRGSVGSSFAAFLMRITEVNPLVPHYRCECGYSQFIEDSTVSCGADLPKCDCPKCGKDLARDGFDIPFETFLGFEGDKVPDIDLNFSGDYQAQAHQFVEELFGKDHVFRAGTISTIAEKTAFGFVKKYEEDAKLRYRKSEIDRLVKGITGVRRTTGQHPGGLIVVPKEFDVYDFTPIQHPADDVKSDIITTHFQYEALHDTLVKLDILGHDDPTVIRSLEELTGFKATTIPLDEPETMKLFSGVESLKVKPAEIRSQIGTYGVPEFGTRFVRQMLEATKPTKFSELIRISGLSHGTDVWSNNAQELIRDETATLTDVIATRDDIMTFLIHKGLEKKQAFKIMENVRKGKGLSQEEIEIMSGKEIPEWYIRSCNKIKYMFPKAHAVAYVMMAYRIAYFKVYYPLAFYASFFTIRAEDFDEVIVKGYDEVKRRIDVIEKMGYAASPKERNLVTILELALEMYARGFEFYQVDLYESDSVKFRIHKNGLLLPFSALPGVGANASRSLMEARAQGDFLSIEDLQRRSRINKTVIEILERNGCLEGLPQSEQCTLFG